MSTSDRLLQHIHSRLAQLRRHHADQLGARPGVDQACRLAQRNRPADTLAQVVALLGQSAPTFFLGPLLIYLLAYKLDIFPISGYGEHGV